MNSVILSYYSIHLSILSFFLILSINIGYIFAILFVCFSLLFVYLFCLSILNISAIYLSNWYCVYIIRFISHSLYQQ